MRPVGRVAPAKVDGPSGGRLLPAQSLPIAAPAPFCRRFFIDFFLFSPTRLKVGNWPQKVTKMGQNWPKKSNDLNGALRSECKSQANFGRRRRRSLSLLGQVGARALASLNGTNLAQAERRQTSSVVLLRNVERQEIWSSGGARVGSNLWRAARIPPARSARGPLYGRLSAAGARSLSCQPARVRLINARALLAKRAGRRTFGRPAGQQVSARRQLSPSGGGETFFHFNSQLLPPPIGQSLFNLPPRRAHKWRARAPHATRATTT